MKLSGRTAAGLGGRRRAPPGRPEPKEPRGGGSGLRIVVDRRIPRAGADPARFGAVVIAANVAGGVLALLLVAYLLVALIRPGRF
ncbi:MAG: potassium-transporting ATPase subunit F [Saccharopolyspora sp.]|nr:potassium-transporting ATPase subunit F [Saccharopolyspora sp.]